MINPENPQIRIFDTTLRDGEQTQGVSYSPETKLMIAKQLAKLGVDVIEAGFPGASPHEFTAVQTIASEVDGPEIAGLSRTQGSEIQRTWEAIEPAGDRALIHTFIGTSEQQEKKLKRDKLTIYREAEEGVTVARKFTENVEFSPEDASRTDMQFMIDVIKVAVKSGARYINVPDTVGFAQPQEFKDRIERIRQEVSGDYILSVHCHDDMGLATINSLYGILGGARQVEGTINGMGERAGNVALEQVIMAMEVRDDSYPFSHGIDLSQLGPTSSMIVECSGYNVDPRSPYFGINLAVDTAGTHQKAPSAYRIFNQAELGIDSENFPISKLSGTAGLRKRAERLGFGTARITRINGGEAMDEWCDENGRVATDVDIEKVVAESLGIELEDIIEVVDSPVFKMEKKNGSTAELSIRYDGKIHNGVYHAEGGPIEALINGVREIAGISFEIDDFSAIGIERGVASRGLVNLIVKNGDISISSSGLHRSVDHATLNAYISGVNTILRTKQRLK